MIVFDGVDRRKERRGQTENGFGCLINCEKMNRSLFKLGHVASETRAASVLRDRVSFSSISLRLSPMRTL